MQWKSYFWPWHSISDLKVELLNGEKNYFLCDGKVIFWPWHSVANLQVELPNGEQKMKIQHKTARRRKNFLCSCQY